MAGVVRLRRTWRLVHLAPSACRVRYTDLHLAEGDLAQRRKQVIPGHEIVGRVDAVGRRAQSFRLGDRVGFPG